MQKALITDITGQDGAYLNFFLLDKNYEVRGIPRHASAFNTDRIDHPYCDPHNPDTRIFPHYGDFTDGGSPRRIIHKIQPRVSFKELVGMMVENDLELAEQERTLIDAGQQVPFRGAGNA